MLLLELQETAVMSCLADVGLAETSTITWWRADPDGSVSQVTSMGGTSINTMPIGMDQLMSNLTIDMVNASHTGTYTCSVTTVNGNFNASVLLQLTGQSFLKKTPNLQYYCCPYTCSCLEHHLPS